MNDAHRFFNVKCTHNSVTVNVSKFVFTCRLLTVCLQEICISYLDDCQLERSRHSRQKYLRYDYTGWMFVVYMFCINSSSSLAGKEDFVCVKSLCYFCLSRENYLFTCACVKCLQQADDADVTSEEEMDDVSEEDD